MSRDAILSWILSVFVIIFMFLSISNIANLKTLFLGMQYGVLFSQFALLIKIWLEGRK